MNAFTMNRNRMKHRRAHLFLLVALCHPVLLGSASSGTVGDPHVSAQTTTSEHGQKDSPIAITTEFQLPEASLQTPYEFRLLAQSGVPPFQWSLEKGSLPPGLRIDETGLLRGTPERAGEFQFTATRKDSSRQRVEKHFLLVVRSALILKWKSPARIEGRRIEGSAEVSNTTRDDVDLTFIALAIAGDGRATAIGYQRFILRSGTTNKELPFGDNLPRGTYAVRIDAVGEVAPKNLIYRQWLQTPAPLQVTVGP